MALWREGASAQTMAIPYHAVCRQKYLANPLEHRGKLWYSINRTKSRKAIETSRPIIEFVEVLGVSTEPKAERQLRLPLHQSPDKNTMVVSTEPKAERQLRRIVRCPYSAVGSCVSTEPKAERQLRRITWMHCCRHEPKRINRTKSRKAIETRCCCSKNVRNSSAYQPNQKPKGN